MGKGSARQLLDLRILRVVQDRDRHVDHRDSSGTRLLVELAPLQELQEEQHVDGEQNRLGLVLPRPYLWDEHGRSGAQEGH